MEKDLAYLKKCIFDFVIISKDGLPLKVIELHLGTHHKENNQNNKDILKKSLCERIGLEYQEIF